ncbi:MAG: MltA domain-containing protein, partial [Nostoc sp. C3-bin3]|nr:MltA domain-containing protein [Nostoc sp. C3-bin3]
MRKTLALLSLSLGIALVNPLWSSVAQVPNLLPLPVPTAPDLPLPVPIIPDVTPPLKPIAIGDCTPQHACLGWDEQLWGQRGKTGDRKALLASIDNSLLYLTKKEAIAAYQNYPVQEITLDRVRRSLVRFRQLVVNSKSAAQLQAAVRREFVFYQSVGNDGKGTVKFTAYYEPIYTASRVKTAIY